jgi:hypothetical protein
MLRTAMEQNYFQFDEQYYKQTEGLAMGTPISALMVEAYIQYVEHKRLFPILIKCRTTEYLKNTLAHFHNLQSEENKYR